MLFAEEDTEELKTAKPLQATAFAPLERQPCVSTLGDIIWFFCFAKNGVLKQDELPRSKLRGIKSSEQLQL
jgi:hypothetical protein